MTERSLLAHGVGGRQDLPLPLGWTIGGAVAALLVSFVVLLLVTRRAESVAPAAGTSGAAGSPGPVAGSGWYVPWLDRLVGSTPWRVALRTLGMLLFAYVVLISFWGQDLDTNPLFRIVYIWWWVGLVPFSLLLGRVWRAISPHRTISALLSAARGSSEPLFRYPERLGYWPAALGLLAFTWLELVAPNNNHVGPVRMWLAIYFAVMLVGGQLFGTRFFERCDPFEVYSDLIARLSVWGRDGEGGDRGRLVLRSPLSNLDSLRAAPGLAAVVMVLFGTIVYDSFHDAPVWLDLMQDNDTVRTSEALTTLLQYAGLVGFPLVLGAFYCAGTMLTGVGDVPRRDLPAQLAPSIVPIIAGYIVAHYLTYFWEGGQLALRQASDPLSNGSDWFGTGNLQISYFFAYHPTTVAVIKVLAVVVGHVLGVWSAHIRALQVLPRTHLVTGQIPLLVTMVGFTIGGLYLLFAA